MKVGSEHKIATQTMTTTPTTEVEATVEQVKKCADAGCDIVVRSPALSRLPCACGRLSSPPPNTSPCCCCCCSSPQRITVQGKKEAEVSDGGVGSAGRFFGSWHGGVMFTVFMGMLAPVEGIKIRLKKGGGCPTIKFKPF